MDLLACSQCEHRFYVPGVAAWDGRLCPECGGRLAFTEHGLGSIPLDAHWLDPRGSPAPEVTLVELRPKRQRGGKSGRRIVRRLAGYFPVKAIGRSVEVSVNRGEAADAALRVLLTGGDTLRRGANPDHSYALFFSADKTGGPGGQISALLRWGRGNTGGLGVKETG